jgi:hypothetical protein
MKFSFEGLAAFIAAGFGAICLGGVALAANPTPEGPNVLRARADEVIAAAGAGAVFTNTTDTGNSRITHTASGLMCTFAISDKVTLFLFPAPNPDDHAACGIDKGDSAYQFGARRVGPRAKARDELATTLAFVGRSIPGMTPIASPLPPPRKYAEAWHAIGPTGLVARTQVLVRDGWAYEATFVAPAEEHQWWLSVEVRLREHHPDYSMISAALPEKPKGRR